MEDGKKPWWEEYIKTMADAQKGKEPWWVDYMEAQDKPKKAETTPSDSKSEVEEDEIFVPKENPVSRERYRQKLLVAMNSADPFPTSDGETNPDIFKNQEEYEKELKQYKAVPGKDADTMDFIQNNPDIGHKLHLNVAIKNVQKVSDFLIKKRIYHKHLSGGDIEDGKVFTIYCGSKKNADKIAQILSRELAGLLCRPADTFTAKGEIEYAPNVIGRFIGSGDFVKYGNGLRGITPLRDDAMLIYGGANAHLLPAVFNKAFDKLSEIYGEFFYGEE